MSAPCPLLRVIRTFTGLRWMAAIDPLATSWVQICCGAQRAASGARPRVSCVSGVSYPGPLPSNPQGPGAEIKGDDQAPERLPGAFGNDFFDSIDPNRTLKASRRTKKEAVRTGLSFEEKLLELYVQS